MIWTFWWREVVVLATGGMLIGSKGADCDVKSFNRPAEGSSNDRNISLRKWW
ncbi:MAG: hypothetical protein ACTS6G_01140 [Candidatus Hodgkinia cicadicola]